MLRKMFLWVLAIFIAVVFVVISSHTAQAEENKPQIELYGEVTAGYTTTVTVRTNYVYWELYFNTNNGVQEFPSNCTQNVVGGVTCPRAEQYQFVIEISPIGARELWIFARTTFGDVIADTELIVPVGTDDYFQVRPGEISEYMYYLGNDSLGGNWISTGIQPAETPFSYTSPSPGVLQVMYPITGTFVFTYFVDTNEGRLLGNIFLEVTPNAHPSLFPDLEDDQFEMEEGATRSFNLLANDRLPAERDISFGIVDVQGIVEYDVPTIAGLQVISPTTGIYTFTYYVDVIGVGRDTAEVVVHVRPTDVRTPPEIPDDEMPILHLEYYLPMLYR